MSSKIDGLFDDFQRLSRGDLPEGERLLLEARIANRRRAANKQRNQENRARAVAEAAKRLRSGGRMFETATPIQDAFAAHLRKLKPQEAAEQRARLAAKKRRAQAMTTANESLADLVKRFQ